MARASKPRALGPNGTPRVAAKVRRTATPARRINPKNTKVSRRAVVR